MSLNENKQKIKQIPGNNLKNMTVTRTAKVRPRVRHNTFVTLASRIPPILSINYTHNISTDNINSTIRR
jgi:hypothetical protein